MKRIALYIFLFLIIFKSLHTQESTFTASTSSDKVTMGEQFEVTFTLNGSGKNFKAPAFDDFIVLSGPNQSQSIQIINGQLSQTVTYSYILQPRSEGKFTIPPASIEIGGKRIQSNSLTIEVLKGTAKPQTRNQQKSIEDENLTKQIGQNLFIRATVDKSEVFQGEQLTVTYKLYTRLNIINSSISKVPAFTGFWAQDIELDRNQNYTIETIDGVQYRAIPVKKTALFPQRSGNLEIDPMEANFVVQVQLKKRTNDWFDQFFNDPFFGNVVNKEFTAKSNSIRIRVKPLPENPPATFNGAVGKFDLDAWLDKTETKSNEPVTLKIKITGKGNLKLMEPIKLNFPIDFESYEPKISDNINQKTTTISGSRTFEYLLIPRRQGNYKIPEIKFTYFDIERKSYQTLTFPEMKLVVTKGTDIVGSPIAGLTKEEIKLIGQDIRFIKSGSSKFIRNGSSFLNSTKFFLLFFTPFLILILSILIINKYESNLQDIVGYKNRRATKIAKKRLNLARKLMENQNKEKFYEEVNKALWGYLSDKLSIQLAELNKDNVTSTLKAKNVKEETTNRLLKILEECEYYRFAPSSDSTNMKNIYEEAIKIVIDIEDEL